MSISLSRFLVEANRAETPGRLFEQFSIVLRHAGYKHFAYHVVAREFRRVGAGDDLVAHNCPVDWITRYVDQEYGSIDPIMETARRCNRPFYWKEVECRPTLSAAQRVFLADLGQQNFGAGLSIPVVARPGDLAYFCLAPGFEKEALSEEAMSELQFLCQAVHLRFDALAYRPQLAALSPRESEVLALIVEGNSNSEIAVRLGLSVNTIATLCDRCFRKLEVGSRFEAGIIALCRGLALLPGRSVESC